MDYMCVCVCVHTRECAHHKCMHVQVWMYMCVCIHVSAHHRRTWVHSISGCGGCGKWQLCARQHGFL